MQWKRKNPKESDVFFNRVFRKIIKQVKQPIEDIKLKFNNRLYKLQFQWQDKDICGIDVYEQYDEKDIEKYIIEVKEIEDKNESI